MSAARGVVLIGLGFVVAALGRTAPRPVDARLLHLSGTGVDPGWYEADDMARAAREAGGAPPRLANAELRDGDSVRLVGDWALADALAPGDLAPAPRGLGDPSTEQEAPEPAGGSIAVARLSLNRATRAQLEGLPGIGPTLAGRIVAGRPYARVEDLDAVKGIGPATLRRVAPLVRP